MKLTDLLDSIGERKYLTNSEQGALFDEFHQMEDLSKQVFCLTLFYTGGRITEVLSLTPQRIDYSDGKIVFQTLKQRKKVRYRAVPMPVELALLLSSLAKGNNIEPNEQFWKFTRQHGLDVIKKAMAGAGIYGCRATTRGLRHTFATSNIELGVPLSKLQKWLGHARLENTAIYLDFTGEEERAYAEKRWEKLSKSKKVLARSPDGD